MLKYCVSSILIALDYVPGASGNHQKMMNALRQRPRPLVGADLVEFRSTKGLSLKPPLGGNAVMSSMKCSNR